MYFWECFLIAGVLTTVFYILNKLSFKRVRKYPMVILGSGGHTTEMLDLLEKFHFDKMKEVVFVTAQTDTTSVPRATDFLAKQNINVPTRWITIPRSRQVKQSYVSSVFTTLKALIYSFYTVLRHYRHIDILITNGPGTCLPIAFTYVFLNCLSITKCKIVFVESWCRVKSLSLTGKILKPIAHSFFVQWESLKQRYPSTTLIKR